MPSTAKRNILGGVRKHFRVKNSRNDESPQPATSSSTAEETTDTAPASTSVESLFDIGGGTFSEDTRNPVRSILTDMLAVSLIDQLHIDQTNTRLVDTAKRYLQEVQRFHELYDMYAQRGAELSNVDTEIAKSVMNEASLNANIEQCANAFGILLSDVLRTKELK
jgi:hypothetical protein